MNSILVTIKKELRSIIRDKKILLTLFAMPLAIAFMIFLYGFMFDNNLDKSEDVYKVGINFDINMMQTLAFNESNLIPVSYSNKKAMSKAFKRGKIDGYISYNKDKDKYYIYTDNSETGIYVNQFSAMYFQFCNSQEAANYLTSKDIDYQALLTKYKFENVEIEGNDYFLNMIYSIIFDYVIMGIVATAVAMSISTVPTEKENGTLETVLSFPVSKKELILGKYFANFISCTVTSAFGYIVALLSLLVSKNLFESFNKLNINFGFANIITGVLICIFASCLIAGVSLLLAINSKSSKEAQVKEGWLTYISMVPIFVNILSLNITSPLYYMIPIVNFTQMLMDLFMGKLNILFLVVTFISSALYSVACLYLVLKLYKSEKVLFNA